MKFKFEVDLNGLEQDLLLGIKRSHQAAFETAASLADQGARDTAAGKLRSGLAKWNEGYSFRRVSDDTFVMAISGKLASMMEDGIDVGEISRLLMGGNRAKHNASEGKDYVDVPLDQGQVAVSFHKDADSLTSSFKRKEVKLSDLRNGGVRKEQRLVRRLENTVIESRKTLDDPNPSFLKIRRVTSKSVWPKQKFEGAKAFEKVAKDFAENFMKILESSL